MTSVFVLLFCVKALGVCSIMREGEMNGAECNEKRIFYSELINENEQVFCMMVIPETPETPDKKL